MCLANLVKVAARSGKEQLQSMLDCFGGGWQDASTCKKAVKQVQIRLTRLKNARASMVKRLAHNVAHFLEKGDVDSAFLNLDQIEEDENMIRVHELLGRFCKLIIANFRYICRHRDCPDEVKEAVSTLTYASTRCRDLPELRTIRELFVERYGGEFERAAVKGSHGSLVNLEVKELLNVVAGDDDDDDAECRRVCEIVGEQNWRLVVANREMEAKLTKRKGKGQDGIERNASRRFVSEVVDVACGRSYRFEDSCSGRFRERDDADVVVASLVRNSMIDKSSEQSETMFPYNDDEEVDCTGSNTEEAGELIQKDDSLGGRNGTMQLSLSGVCSMPQLGCCRSDHDLEIVKRTISLPAKLPSHVHPNLPDCDDLEKKFKALKKKNRKRSSGEQTYRARGRNGTRKLLISKACSMPRRGSCRSEHELEIVKRTISLPANLPSHVHPCLPDCDDLEETFKAMKEEHRKRSNGKQTYRVRGRNGPRKLLISRACSRPQLSICA